MRVHERILIPVSAIRYSQDFILSSFEDTHRTLTETVEDINSGRLSPQDYPQIYVWLYGSLFFTHNNRWLWVYKKAGVERVIGKLLYPKQIDPAGKKWFTFEHTENFSRFKDPLYVPVIRSPGESVQRHAQDPPGRSGNPAKPSTAAEKCSRCKCFCVLPDRPSEVHGVQKGSLSEEEHLTSEHRTEEEVDVPNGRP